ncbi:cob(I)yrinic acid a,c-diamide adenosyltransferase [Phascolarctobacterium sp. ET69]|uniref:cob(I)yrinic acid a,c-diamide adenosyltransferase n=1 Tax=Phascolarctobacterium sp. ET69 TaxID=2939420 RepID=UPI002012964E|nr:cob(I)yrinic acid a,c-diamide adenosyltransferase [Phascolarctobacterium sp. ET69]MCL1604747.1 cob(I)yrinic acid a,c-diamide adenosyltransferase [Phascolarctobacterium sp. ET69]
MFGLIHIYCGDGKGKTTAAVGLAVRCAGRGNKVLLVQFLKSRDSGELYSLAKLPDIEVMRGKESKKFTFQMNEEEKHALLIEHNKMFEQVLAKIKNGGYSLLILDEVIGALNAKVFEMPKLIEFLRHKPENLEIVLTGRNPAPELVEIADYVSEMRKVKHPMDKGIMAREGIEK